jgi:hypothetical protein
VGADGAVVVDPACHLSDGLRVSAWVFTEGPLFTVGPVKPLDHPVRLGVPFPRRDVREPDPLNEVLPLAILELAFVSSGNSDRPFSGNSGRLSRVAGQPARENEGDDEFGTEAD